MYKDLVDNGINYHINWCRISSINRMNGIPKQMLWYFWKIPEMIPFWILRMSTCKLIDQKNINNYINLQTFKFSQALFWEEISTHYHLLEGKFPPMTFRLPTQQRPAKVPTLKFTGYRQVSSQEGTFCFTGVFLIWLNWWMYSWKGLRIFTHMLRTQFLRRLVEYADLLDASWFTIMIAQTICKHIHLT